MERLERLPSTHSTIVRYRDSLLERQGGVDPVLAKPPIRPVLDHDHKSGRCRGTLENEMNAFIGKVENAYGRFLSHLTQESISAILRRLADYLEQDYSANPLHHTEIGKSVRSFRSMSADAQKDLLRSLGAADEDMKNSKKRGDCFRKMLKSNRVLGNWRKPS